MKTNAEAMIGRNLQAPPTVRATAGLSSLLADLAYQVRHPRQAFAAHVLAVKYGSAAVSDAWRLLTEEPANPEE